MRDETHNCLVVSRGGIVKAYIPFSNDYTPEVCRVPFHKVTHDPAVPADYVDRDAWAPERLSDGYWGWLPSRKDIRV